MKESKTEQEVNAMSPLILAYIGDAVYELYIREYLVNTTNLKPNKLHSEAIKYVCAKAQSEVLKELEEVLSEKEQEIVRRARNTKNHHLPKNTKVIEYIYSTAYEALIGYLYMTRQDDRLKYILEYSREKLVDINTKKIYNT